MKFVYWCFFALLFSCSPSKKSEQENPPLEASQLPGETLAKMYCGSCHSYVPPNMLDKKTWERKTLPEMGLRLGIGDVFSKNVLQVQQGTENLVYENIYPLKPKIHEEDYKKIVDFYLKNAPEKSLPQKNKLPIQPALKGFKYLPILKSDGFQNNTTAIGFDSITKQIMVGSPRGVVLNYKFVDEEILKDSLMEPGVFSLLKKNNASWYLLDLGKLGPHEKRMGKLVKVDKGNSSIVLNNLHKPADFAFFDVNNDGFEDIVVCNFGFETGSLSWYDGKTQKENIIKKQAGARNLYVEDMDGDGLKDLVVLFAQGLEGISIFYNKGNGKFKEKEVLAFSPVYGSSWFQLVDFNKDGKLDILYINGDNADYSNTLKNYHGIRIFTNKGNNTFSESYFYPLYGATKGLAADFDGDGDLDIAAIAYYRNDPAEGFVFLENDGKNNFSPSTFKEVKSGQWMALEIGDVDGDGLIDIILGAHDLGRQNEKSRDEAELVILKGERVKNR